MTIGENVDIAVQKRVGFYVDCVMFKNKRGQLTRIKKKLPS